jgi:transposase
MKKTGYTSDLTTEQYQKIAIHFKKRKTAPRTVQYHDIVNGILYRLKNGCSWENLPKDFPNYKTVFHYSNLWIKEGIWDMVLDELKIENRIDQKKCSANSPDM